MSKLLAVAAAAALGLGATQAFATTLDFTTPSPGVADEAALPSTYGSNIGDTPNVAVSWGSNARFYGSAGYETAGDVAVDDVVYSFGDGGDFTITFDAADGFYVILNSITVATWNAGNSQNLTYSVVAYEADGTTEVSNTGNLTTGRAASLSLGDIQSGAGGVIVFTFNEPAGMDYAIDNVTFNQDAVPEPGALALLGLGGLALLRRRRA